MYISRPLHDLDLLFSCLDDCILLDEEGATEVAGEEMAVRSDQGKGETERSEDVTDLVDPDARLLRLPVGEEDIIECRDEGRGGGKSASSGSH